MRLFYILVFIIFCNKSFSACDLTTGFNENVTDPLPPSDVFLINYTDGLHQFNGEPNLSGFVLTYWDSEKVTFPDARSYQWQTNGSNLGYSLNSCQSIDSSGTGLYCQYLQSFSKTCPTGYQLSASQGMCILFDLDSCLVDQPTICSDGLGPDLAGYPGCDRPDLIECADTSYVRADTGICPTSCTDYVSCYLITLENSSCSNSEFYEFNYIDPLNFSFSCTSIDPNSPDSDINGGNTDGNPYNDPNTPTEGDGSILSSSEIDPYSLAALIGEELRTDFSNIERAIRDDIDQSKINTETIETAANNISSLMTESINNDNNNTSILANEIGSLGDKLLQINNSLNSGPCDPKQSDYYSCLDTPLNELPTHSQSNSLTIGEINSEFKNRITQSQVVQAFSSMASLIRLENSSCPEFSIDLRDTLISELISTSIHCDLMNQIKPVLSPVMIVLFIWVAFRIFASA